MKHFTLKKLDTKEDKYWFRAVKIKIIKKTKRKGDKNVFRLTDCFKERRKIIQNDRH